MIKLTTIAAAFVVSLGLTMPVFAQEEAEAEEAHIEKQQWTFAGPLGKFDEAQLQRGFQVFREVCASCHGARLLAFRNLEEEGGPHYTEGQVKELAAQYEVTDAESGQTRVAIASDRWPSPFPTEQDARDANGGSLPPDMSVLAKARSIESNLLEGLAKYFTTYSEGGVDYIHALLNGYTEAPEGFELPEGKYYNLYFSGNAIGMPPPLSEGQVQYAADEAGNTPPMTVEQYSKDVAAFMMWMAEPHMTANKAAGFRTIAFLILFAGLMYFVKQRLWSKVH